MSDVHALRPFPGELHPEVRLEAVLRRQADTLLLSYLLRGELTNLVLPGAAASPARRDNLWQETCFELFWARVEGAGYWEANLSPAGHWNLYLFADYRLGMRPEPTLTTLPFAVARQETTLAITLELDLAVLAGARKQYTAGLSAVLRARDGSVSHWALSHPGKRPDFHRRDSFLLRI